MSVLEVVCELQAEDRAQGKGNFLKSCSKTTLVKLLSWLVSPLQQSQPHRQVTAAPQPLPH